MIPHKFLFFENLPKNRNGKIDRKKIVHNGPERVGKDAHYRLDCTKSKEALNWQPTVSLKEGLFEVSEWISSNLNKLSLYSWEYIQRN